MLKNRHEPIRTLLVDSERSSLQKLEKILNNLDYEVVAMNNGLEALEFAKLEKPDLIISEFRLKGLDGLSLCRLLKSDDRYRNIRVILTVHHSCMENKVLAEQSDADDIVFKPYRNKELLETIEMITGRCELEAEDGLRTVLSE
jgi:CheY-like chemotaxis protein